jgi:hypothetical protein
MEIKIDKINRDFSLCQTKRDRFHILEMYRPPTFPIIVANTHKITRTIRREDRQMFRPSLGSSSLTLALKKSYQPFKKCETNMTLSFLSDCVRQYEARREMENFCNWWRWVTEN